jgi:hypothetical protein
VEKKITPILKTQKEAEVYRPKKQVIIVETTFDDAQVE